MLDLVDCRGKESLHVTGHLSESMDTTFSYFLVSLHNNKFTLHSKFTIFRENYKKKNAPRVSTKGYLKDSPDIIMEIASPKPRPQWTKSITY